MNLYFRLLLMFARASWRRRISMFDEFRSEHIVWPNDIDVLGHMNNGRYFTITDFVRTEILIRAGIWKQLKQRGVYPVIAGETVQFRKSLQPFQRYTIRTRLAGWDDKFLYVEHQFVRGDTTHALVLIKGRFIGKSRPSPAEVLRYVYPDVPDTNMSDVIDQWNTSTTDHWRQHARAA